MTATTTVTMNADLATALRATAAHDGERFEDVLDMLARSYIRRARRERIRAECEHFAAAQAELCVKYPGEHVAMVDGEVVDHGADPLTLARRVRERLGHGPVLIRPVEGPATPEFAIRSPRLVKLV